MGEWIEVDLTPEELRRFEVIASAHGVSVEMLIGKISRQQVAIYERIGARVALGADSVDIRATA